MNEMSYVLTKDVYSYKGKLYATKGEIVTCTARHGSVWVVKTTTGKRFSIRAEELDTP